MIHFDVIINDILIRYSISLLLTQIVWLRKFLAINKPQKNPNRGLIT